MPSTTHAEEEEEEEEGNADGVDDDVDNGGIDNRVDHGGVDDVIQILVLILQLSGSWPKTGRF